MIIMDSRSQLIVDVIAKVTQGKISINSASQLLNKSRRTIERYLSRYRAEGIRFIVHGNKGRAPINRTPESLKKQVLHLIQTKYYDFNLQHLAELLAENEGLSIKRETLRGWAHEIKHVKRAKRRRSQVRKYRERMESPGLMLQMDGSPHRWFGDSRSCLIAIIDDATSDIHAEFYPSETTEGCMKVMKAYIEKRGLFKTLYVDRAGIFGGPKRCHFSQMQRACEELGIEIIFANSPQGKGRVERCFDTFQDRLVPELRLHNITDMHSANEYLQKVFIPIYWQQKITVKAKSKLSAFKAVPEHIDLDTICVYKEYRKVRRDHTFSYNNKMYVIDSPIRYSIVNQKLEIRSQFDGTFSVYFGHRKLHITELEEPPRGSEFGMEVQRKLDVIELAQTLGSVTKAAQVAGCSRQSIYTYQKVLEEEGVLGLKRINKPLKRNKNRIPQVTEEKIVKLTLNNPYRTSLQLMTELKRDHNITVSSATIRNIWKREVMNTRELRVKRAASLNKEI
ncbi:Integrase catalytic region [Shewanella halifaxensis HAW-EB4]|uniref:Integrase catalytic region n=1 Tax=Shewanella halifaxensis (strain HAW-EB4) TaxID=458817 RepID=B0TJX2_SHEHH|nr:ISNCY-like element ISShha1 family transposase [Shewanella halifaxensis]ABZ75759.1 Integrase catalytic region [Shewanella halifaxensis HAW-EB4]